jgi:hypothetical protein
MGPVSSAISNTRQVMMFWQSLVLMVFKSKQLFYRDDKVKGNISRIFKIWGERGIYDETFIADLNGLLDCPKGVSSDTAKLVAEFQVS